MNINQHTVEISTFVSGLSKDTEMNIGKEDGTRRYGCLLFCIHIFT